VACWQRKAMQSFQLFLLSFHVFFSIRSVSRLNEQRVRQIRLESKEA
jgi:hypothetical protein